MVELAVTLAGLAVVGLMAVQAHVQLARGTAEVVQSAEATAAARMAIDNLERQIRSGNVLLTSTSGPAETGCVALGASGAACLRVYTQLNGRPRCAEWRLTADPSTPGTGWLRSRSYSPSWTTDGDVSGWQLATRGLVVPDAANPPFQIRAGSAYGARLLDVRIAVADSGRDGRTTTVTTALNGRNTTYGYNPSVCADGPP